jgi:hypothetical protein
LAMTCLRALLRLHWPLIRPAPNAAIVILVSCRLCSTPTGAGAGSRAFACVTAAASLC